MNNKHKLALQKLKERVEFDKNFTIQQWPSSIPEVEKIDRKLDKIDTRDNLKSRLYQKLGLHIQQRKYIEKFFKTNKPIIKISGGLILFCKKHWELPKR